VYEVHVRHKLTLYIYYSTRLEQTCSRLPTPPRLPLIDILLPLVEDAGDIFHILAERHRTRSPHVLSLQESQGLLVYVPAYAVAAGSLHEDEDNEGPGYIGKHYFLVRFVHWAECDYESVFDSVDTLGSARTSETRFYRRMVTLGSKVIP
jgi:hypothetical protein